VAGGGGDIASDNVGNVEAFCLVGGGAVGPAVSAAILARRESCLDVLGAYAS